MRRREILKRPRVPTDIEENASSIAGDSLDAALRFIDAVEITFERLLDMPLIGSPREIRNPALKGLRLWPVQGFPNHLVFYIPREDAVEIIRVLHGARDWIQILGEESAE